MSLDKDKEDKFLISLSDIFRLFKNNKEKIIWCTLLMACLGAFYALTRPIKYKAEGTFRERTNKSGGITGSLMQLLSSESSSSSGPDGDSSTVLKSRKMMTQVIDKLNLQGSITQKCDEEGLLKRVGKNIKIEWGSFKKRLYPVLPDTFCPVKVESIQYLGEVPLFFDVYMEPDGRYEVFDAMNQSLGKGTVETPFVTKQCSFILKKMVPGPVSKPLPLIINSMADAAVIFAHDLNIESNKNDKSLLKISYTHRNRHFASNLVNMLMECYQDHLRQNHEHLAKIQLNYLLKREEESAQKLADLMHKHADFLSQDLSTVGFADSKKEMDFLAESEHQFKDRLLANDLEVKRLSGIQFTNFIVYDQYNAHTGHSDIINTILTDVRDLKQQEDSLEIALQENMKGHDLQAEVFEYQLNEIHMNQQYLQELKDLIVRYQDGLTPDASSTLLTDSRFLLKHWFDRLQELKETDAANWEKAKENFSFYLANLKRLLEVHGKILQDRLTHQQNPRSEYQGIGLEMANNLYLEYSRRAVDIESEIRQKRFLLAQLETPTFEMSSLSAGLTDFVSLEMIKQASDLTMRLKDQSNQSSREQERLKTELSLQRDFLIMHVNQMIHLTELHKQLINEKIYALQNINLELTRQKVSLLEKNLHEYVESRLENLKQEKSIIQQHLDEIHREMASLPKRWMSEQLIEQQVDINQLIVKEIATMVESKNISHNLEVILSAPLDSAIAPVHPVVPGLKLYAFLGAVLGAFLSSGFVLVRSLTQGIQASIQNLKLIGQHVSGHLSADYNPQSKEPIKDTDLDTLRRLHSYFDQGRPIDPNGRISNSLLLLIEGRGPNYAFDLADLILKKGEKVLVINLNFDRPSTHHQPGLLQYLQGEVKKPVIITGDRGDYIQAGGVSRFSIELLSSRLFQDLLEELQSKYNWIIPLTHALPSSAEAESLASLFPSIAVTVEKESLDELEPYTNLTVHSSKKVSFILMSDK